MAAEPFDLKSGKLTWRYQMPFLSDAFFLIAAGLDGNLIAWKPD